MWLKAEWMGHPMRLELTRVGLLVKLANRYTTIGARCNRIFVSKFERLFDIGFSEKCFYLIDIYKQTFHLIGCVIFAYQPLLVILCQILFMHKICKPIVWRIQFLNELFV